ncbi:MAG: hypothetical protein DI598_15175 [Pseudopedobacter saltans]|uniref:Uncharacterized protein n=1 Tax=Pseudopedobacter saltans TaxID=151895 RepID=A0A2W5EID5_9SPHI|nr:MAG: hypothetical protein DI598_15175 [Pseudopedobacter saltans]
MTLIPGSCAALAPKLDASTQVCIGENSFDDYESIWEMLLTDVLEQKDVQYQSDDFPISAHLSAKNAFNNNAKLLFLAPTLPENTICDNQIDILHKHNTLLSDSKNAFAQYYDYLFRLTPF